MAYGFDVSGLSAWTDETSQKLVKKAVATDDFTKLGITVLPGIKGTTALNLLNNTVTLTSGGCGFQPTGSVALTQRDLTVTSIKVNDQLCQETLDQYWLSATMRPGFNPEVPQGEVIMDSYIDGVKLANSYNIWQGNYTGSSYTKFDGFMEVLCDASSSGTVAGTDAPTVVLNATGSMTADNAITIVGNMLAAASADVLSQPDLTMFVNYADYNAYISALVAANRYHFKPELGNFMYTIDGTPYKIVAQVGLAGKNARILTPASNLVLGTDLLSETDQVKMWYSEDDEVTKVSIKYKLGTSVYHPEWVYMTFNKAIIA